MRAHTAIAPAALRAAATLAVLALVLGPTSSRAADALAICQSGVPYAYPDGGVDIPFNPDLGGLGPLTNAQAVAAVQAAFDRWADVPEATVTYLNAGPLAVDIDITNYGPIFSPLAPNGLSEIVFDEDGSIFIDLFGPNSGILGFAGPDFGNPTTCELLEGSAFLNGPEFDDALVAEDIMVHEFGHYTNLGHVELNGQLVAFGEGGDTSGPTPDNTTFGLPASFLGTEVIETMYPFYFGSPDVGTRTPHADDVASLAAIYPSPALSARGSISGTIFAPDGVTRLSGVNVIARNLADPFVDAVSTFSGAYTDSTSQADPNVGTFVLHNLTPGASYALFVDQVTANPGRFSNPIIQIPGPEEFWNDGESNGDPVDELTEIVPSAGLDVGGIDVIFNEPQPGVPLPVGEDGSVQVSLGFEFEICEQSFSSVFVNANGNLTFGVGSTDFTESAAELLAGPPRIAGLWDDISPFNLFTGAPQGTVTFARSKNTFTVFWTDVPEFENTGSNTFSITLKRSSNQVELDYDELTAVDGIAGVTCGGMFTSGTEPQTDLSASNGTHNLTQTPAIYEVFTASNPFDLENSKEKFNGTKKFRDKFEDNDTPAQAAFVSLPFNSDGKQNYTEIFPVGGDIDWFAFDASAGEVLIAEIVGGQLDSLIALFAPDGTLVAADDDGGAGVLSRIATILQQSGVHLLAVTTFPDFDLTGEGGSGGRYVLDMETREDLPLALGDDASAEVPLPFAFPFQGANHTSVFVNSNGNLTFGSGDTDFSESVAELLSDQPRIAPLWDDLSPNQGGSVTVTFAAGSATVQFTDVPEFLAGTPNTFAVTLHADGSIDVEYGTISAADGLAGITEGGGAADPGESDLSIGGPFSATGTTYELFSSSDNDLDGVVLAFDP